MPAIVGAVSAFTKRKFQYFGTVFEGKLHVAEFSPKALFAGMGSPLPDTADDTVKYDLGSLQSFNGTTGYLGFSPVPRGAGYEAGDYKAHDYRIISEGFGPRNSKIRIEAGFYRIGL